MNGGIRVAQKMEDNMPQKIVIIGGVAAGTSAAAKARRCDEDAEITIFERDSYISYGSCGFPFYISGSIPDMDKLVFNTPETFKKSHNIDVFAEHDVKEIEPDKKRLKVLDLKTNRLESFSYDKLLITTGARAVVPPIEGIDLPHIYTLRTVDDAKRIREFIVSQNPKKAVVVGAGLIGLEMVEALLERKLQVTLVEMLDQVLPNFDWEMAKLMENHLKEQGVELILSDAVKEFKGGKDGVNKIITRSGAEIDADVVLVSVGVKPNTEIVQDIGMDLGVRNTIKVDARMETSIGDIFAAGDCVESTNLVSGMPTWAPMGSVANKQGRIAGENMVGRDSRFRGVLGTCITKVFDYKAAKTGLSEAEARKHGFDLEISYTHPYDLLHCYPGAAAITMKMIANKKTNEVLGAQIMGIGGVDKRIDVIATSILAGFTDADLFHIDLAYAPPFSPAKDPVIVSGMVAENGHKGDSDNILPSELKKRMDDGEEFLILDVRSPQEFDTYHLKGAKLVHVEELRQRLDELEPFKEKEIVVCCRTGIRSYRACRILMNNGFTNIKNLTGGLSVWSYEFDNQ